MRRFKVINQIVEIERNEKELQYLITDTIKIIWEEEEVGYSEPEIKVVSHTTVPLSIDSVYHTIILQIDRKFT